MIKKIQADISADIQASIKDNTSGDITGDLLQEKMLLLNRDLFGGEIEYDTHILLEDVERAVVNMRLRTDSDLFNFVKEWYNDGTWQNSYIALYGGISNAYIVGYMRMYVVGSAIIHCYLLGCASNLTKLVIHPESADMEDNFILPEEAQYKSKPTLLRMYLPSANTTYTSLAAMLSDLGITDTERENLLNGQYTYITGDYGITYPIMKIERTDDIVLVGYNDGIHYTIWEMSFFSSYQVNYRTL